MKSLFLKTAKIKSLTVRELRLKNLSFLDEIVEIEPLYLMTGDTFETSWNIEIKGWTDYKLTSILPVKFKYSFLITKNQTARFVRFTMRDNNAKIQFYEKLPKTLYTPTKWDAIKQS